MTEPLRDVQLSLVDGMERPVGPLPLSVQTGTNADLIAKVAPLYLAGSVLDVTYGEGKWWDKFTPDPFTFHDKFKVDGVDFTALPEADDSIDSVCFDPPYIASGGTGTKQSARDFQDRFGVGCDKVAGKDLGGLVLDGLTEVCRVARSFVLVKCMEFVGGSDLCDMPTQVTNAAAGNGWKLHDRIVHNTGTGPGGHNIFKVKRARRAHSYLLVFTKTRPA
jgi:hypothetical protein